MNEPSIDIVLNQFSKLTKALIDASSIIYSSKAGFLDILGETIRLYTIPEIFTETLQDQKNIQLIESHNHNDRTDDKLLAIAFDLDVSVISEDKKILIALEKENKPYFNSLMMLNFLFYKNKISATGFRQKRERLKDIAWYSQSVWDFGDSVFNSQKQSGY
ncbi:hypothetical protein H8E88_15385 [candidate division KSB1 bacterium]|nr:hypothetical protein [candidate division KSB1 bacterium]MBL7095204.1 hypothetical protein [candidate division KSB1 bacterium]